MSDETGGEIFFVDTLYTNANGEDTYEFTLVERFEQTLDSVQGRVDVAGLSFSPSRILRVLDHSAYRAEYNRWLEAEGWWEK